MSSAPPPPPPVGSPPAPPLAQSAIGHHHIPQAPSPVQGLGIATAVIFVLHALAGIMTAGQARQRTSDLRVAARIGLPSDFVEGSVHSLVAVTETMTQLGLVVLVIVWFHRCYRNIGRWNGPTQRSTGWAIGAWFIPIGNLFIPKAMLDEITAGSRSTAATSQPDSQSGTPPRRLVLVEAWWWITALYVLAVGLATLVAASTGLSAGIEAGRTGDDVVISARDLLASTQIERVVTILGVIAALLGVGAVLTITRMQTERARAGAMPVDPAAAGPTAAPDSVLAGDLAWHAAAPVRSGSSRVVLTCVGAVVAMAISGILWAPAAVDEDAMRAEAAALGVRPDLGSGSGTPDRTPTLGVEFDEQAGDPSVSGPSSTVMIDGPRPTTYDASRTLHHVYRPSNSVLTARASPSSLSVMVDGDHDWEISMWAPAGTDLAAQRYEGVQTVQGNPVRPLLHVSGTSGCYEPTGFFDISALDIDDGLRRLVATFELRCPSGDFNPDQQWRGSIDYTRLEDDDATTPPPVAEVVAGAESTATITYYDPFERANRTDHHNPGVGTLEIGEASVSFTHGNQDHVRVAMPGGAVWSLGTHRGEDLILATRSFCASSALISRIDVHELERNADGFLTKLRLDFERAPCDGHVTRGSFTFIGQPAA